MVSPVGTIESTSIEDIPFVVLNAVLLQEGDVFLLKRLAAVVLLLTVNIAEPTVGRARGRNTRRRQDPHLVLARNPTHEGPEPLANLGFEVRLAAFGSEDAMDEKARVGVGPNDRLPIVAS